MAVGRHLAKGCALQKSPTINATFFSLQRELVSVNEFTQTILALSLRSLRRRCLCELPW